MSAARTGRRTSGAAKNDSAYGFERLEQAVEALAARKQQLESENAELQRTLDTRGRTIRDLELRALESNQRRKDARKRLDELIERVEGLEARAGSAKD
jgi:chromosome segregation ATPase